MNTTRFPMEEAWEEVPANASSVRIGDVIVIGGTRFKILNMANVPGGMKRLTFTTGETLTLRTTTPFYCERPLRYRRPARPAPGRRW